MNGDDRPYRRGIGIMLLNRASDVLVGQRRDNPGEAWQMPQGGIDADEAPIDAAWREMREEIGTNLAELLAESSGWLRYDLPTALSRRLWRGRYRGQEQKWFAFRFTGRDDDIDLGAQEPEFSAWKWAPMPALPDLIVPFKRRLYRDILDEFGHLAAGPGRDRGA